MCLAWSYIARVSSRVKRKLYGCFHRILSHLNPRIPSPNLLHILCAHEKSEWRLSIIELCIVQYYCYIVKIIFSFIFNFYWLRIIIFDLPKKKKKIDERKNKLNRKSYNDNHRCIMFLLVCTFFFLFKFFFFNTRWWFRTIFRFLFVWNILYLIKK